MKPNSILKSKWFLALILISGLLYFEAKVNAQLVERPILAPTEASLR